MRCNPVHTLADAGRELRLNLISTLSALNDATIHLSNDQLALAVPGEKVAWAHRYELSCGGA